MSTNFKAAAWACILVSAIAAMAISYSGLYGLALTTGFEWWAAPLLPIAIDVTIVGATLVWLGQGAPVAAFGFARGLALVAISTSVLANATFHGLAGGERWWLAAIVASIPPAFLAALVHLGALLVRTETSEPVEAEQPLPARQEPHQSGDEPHPEAGSDLVTSEDARQAPPSLREQVVAAQAAARADGKRVPGRQVLARQLGVREHEVRQVLDQLRQEPPARLAVVGQA